MKINLTEKAVAKLKAPTASGKQELVWDEKLRGFGVLLSGKTNAEDYIVQRDLPTGRARRVTIGSVAEMSLEAAREEATDAIHAFGRARTRRRAARRRQRSARPSSCMSSGRGASSARELPNSTLTALAATSPSGRRFRFATSRLK